MEKERGAVSAVSAGGDAEGGAGGDARGGASLGGGEEEARPKGMQKNPGKGAKWVTPERALEVMQESKRKGRAAYWQD